MGSLLHFRYYDYRCANWYQDFFLTSYTPRHSSGIRKAYALGTRLLILVHSRGIDRDCSGEEMGRYCTPRHILRRGSLSLRIVYGGCVCYFCGCILLVLYYYWHISTRAAYTGSIRRNVYWGEPYVFPTAFLRITGYTSPILRLS